MLEVSIACEDHADVELVAAVDGFLVAYGAARLDDGGDTCFVGQLHTVVEGEEGIRGQHSTVEVEIELLGLLDGLPQSVDPGGLPDARSAQLLVLDQGDGVGAAVFDDLVGEDQILDFRP